MSVQWATMDEGITQAESIVMYGLSPETLTSVVSGGNYTFTDSGEEKHALSHHVCIMSQLKGNTKYFYQVGDPKYELSEVFDFISAPSTEDMNLPLRFGIWGDMGFENAQILSSVLKEVENDNFDMILHVGDFGYDLHSDNGRTGDNFMNSIQPMSSRVPYMVSHVNYVLFYPDLF